jgi:hypothetical protein
MGSLDVRILSHDDTWPERRYQLEPEPEPRWSTFFADALRRRNMAAAALNPGTRIEKADSSDLRVTDVSYRSAAATDKFVATVVNDAPRQALQNTKPAGRIRSNPDGETRPAGKA